MPSLSRALFSQRGKPPGIAQSLGSLSSPGTANSVDRDDWSGATAAEPRNRLTQHFFGPGPVVYGHGFGFVPSLEVFAFSSRRRRLPPFAPRARYSEGEFEEQSLRYPAPRILRRPGSAWRRSYQGTILAGAFTVGVGFGLQTVINNFVCGLILLFERPIKVGDIIQVDADVGEVRRIGIRACIIRTAEGSEIIVPNGTIIANKVTNWTYSD